MKSKICDREGTCARKGEQEEWAGKSVGLKLRSGKWSSFCLLQGALYGHRNEGTKEQQKKT